MSDDDDTLSHVIAVRRGPGANCSSIGSAVEMLFLSATAGSALLVAVTAMLRTDDDPATPAEPPPPPVGAPSEEAP